MKTLFSCRQTTPNPRRVFYPNTHNRQCSSRVPHLSIPRGFQSVSSARSPIAISPATRLYHSKRQPQNTMPFVIRPSRSIGSQRSNQLLQSQAQGDTVRSVCSHPNSKFNSSDHILRFDHLSQLPQPHTLSQLTQRTLSSKMTSHRRISLMSLMASSAPLINITRSNFGLLTSTRLQAITRSMDSITNRSMSSAKPPNFQRPQTPSLKSHSASQTSSSSSKSMFEKYRYLLVPLGITEKSSKFTIWLVLISPILIAILLAIKDKLEKNMLREEREYRKRYEAWEDEQRKKVLQEASPETKKLMESETNFAGLYTMYKKKEDTLFQLNTEYEIRRRLAEEAERKGIDPTNLPSRAKESQGNEPTNSAKILAVEKSALQVADNLSAAAPASVETSSSQIEKQK